MKKTTRRVLLAVLIAVFLVSGGMMLRQLGDYQQGDETYGSAESLAGLPDFSAISWPEESGSGSAAAQDPAVPYVDPYADALAAMASRNPNMRILAISHDPTMKARFVQNIVVTGGEDGSTVTME